MTTDAETLALLVFASRHQSRRNAKRLLREAGGAGTAAELDAMLEYAETHPQWADIEAHVRELARAALDAQMTFQEPARTGEALPHWLIGEDARSDRTCLVYLGPATPFVAEIFDPDDPNATSVVSELDEGQRLGEVRWLGDVPRPERQALLWAQARRELRVYDKRLGL